MGLQHLEVPLSEDGSAKRRRGRRGRRRRPRKGNKPSTGKGRGAKSEDIERGLSRFDLNPRPMGIPAEIDPPPRKIKIRWNTNAVSREVQNRAGTVSYTHLTLPTICSV